MLAGAAHSEFRTAEAAPRAQASSIWIIAANSLRLFLAFWLIAGAAAVLFGLMWAAAEVFSIILNSVGLV